jgi:hypothetical protein
VRSTASTTGSLVAQLLELVAQLIEMAPQVGALVGELLGEHYRSALEILFSQPLADAAKSRVANTAA